MLSRFKYFGRHRSRSIDVAYDIVRAFWDICIEKHTIFFVLYVVCPAVIFIIRYLKFYTFNEW